jgi:hypothetical protein
MFSGPNSPHRPSMVGALVLIIIVVVIYHFMFHRGK